MRSPDDGAGPRQPPEGLLDGSLCRGVEGRGRLIQEQDCRLAEDGSRQGESLPLTAGEASTPFADRGLVALRKGRDESILEVIP